jgi:hypothetical protein
LPDVSNVFSAPCGPDFGGAIRLIRLTVVNISATFA